MKLFGFNFGKKSDKSEKQIENAQEIPFEKKQEQKGKFPVITQTDKEWVETSFQHLLVAYPLKENAQNILFNKDFFPKSFSDEKLTISNLIEDLSNLLELDADKIDFVLEKDISDSYGTPYSAENINYSQTVVTEDGYMICIPNELTKRPNGLLLSLIVEFIRISLIESDFGIDKNDNDEDRWYAELFIYIIGVYFGFGVILCQNFIASGYSTDGFWETKWNYVLPVPKEVMTYALALYCGLIKEENFEWKEMLHSSVKIQFEKAMEFLEKNPPSLDDELEAAKLIEQSHQEYDKNKFDFSISLSNKALLLTQNKLTKADIYNLIGYNQIRNGDFESSITNFEKAIEIYQYYGVAHDNLAYVHTKLGNLEKAKYHLEEAINSEETVLDYHYRNVALYYAAKNETQKAEEYFDMAFKEAEQPVDLLELDYANFLFNQGKNKEGMQYLEMAVKKEEPEAIEQMKKMRN